MVGPPSSWSFVDRKDASMLLTISVVLLGTWVLGLLQLFPLGDFLHVLLLAGLMLLLLAWLKARDAAQAHRRRVSSQPPRGANE